MDDELELLQRFTISVSDGRGNMAMITTHPNKYETDRKRCLEAFISCMIGIGFSYGPTYASVLAEEMEEIVSSAVK